MKPKEQNRRRIRVIGVGPGTDQYLLPIALEKAKECDLLLGSERALDLFQHLVIPTIQYSQNLLSHLEQFKADQLVGVVVAGDPGFYSLLAFFRRHFPEECIEVIPGISSVQYLFAKIATPWQDYHLTSCHGREIDNLVELLQDSNKLVLLTDSKMNPGEICRRLLDSPFSNYRVIVGENLSYSNEKITIGSVTEIARIDQFQMSVVIIDDKW